MNFKVAAAGIALAAAGAGEARADRRAYGETYEAVTAPRGELDVELWTTVSQAGELDGGPSSQGGRQMVELEYGITDRWDVALYNMVDITTDKGDTASGYAGFKVETRYRPTARGQWVVDPVFYLEAQERTRGDARGSLEAKLIVAKDFGKVNVAVNLAAEEEQLPANDHNLEIEWAAGTSYEFSPAFIVAAEVFGKDEKNEEGDVESRAWAGPCVSWAMGRKGTLHGVWVTLAGGVGLTSESDDVYGRAIVGLQF